MWVIKARHSISSHQKTEEEWQNFVDLALGGPDDKRKKVWNLVLFHNHLEFGNTEFWYSNIGGYTLKGNEDQPLLRFSPT